MIRLTLCLALLSASFPALAATSTATAWSGAAEITFSGTSTLHDWAGTVRPRPFTATVVMADNGSPTAVRSTVVVEAAKMNTADVRRDANMRKAMKASDHPLITGGISAPFATITSGTAAPAHLPMVLSLLGKPQSIAASITHWKLTADHATFDLDFDLSMSASGISVPPVLHFITVGDRVHVHAAVTLSRP